MSAPATTAAPATAAKKKWLGNRTGPVVGGAIGILLLYFIAAKDLPSWLASIRSYLGEHLAITIIIGGLIIIFFLRSGKKQKKHIAAGTTPAAPHAPGHHHEVSETRQVVVYWIAIVFGIATIAYFIQGPVPVLAEATKMSADKNIGTHFTEEAKNAYAMHRSGMNTGYGIPTEPFDYQIDIPESGYLIEAKKCGYLELYWGIDFEDNPEFRSKACFGNLTDTTTLNLKSHVPGGYTMYWFGKIPNHRTMLHIWGIKKK